MSAHSGGSTNVHRLSCILPSRLVRRSIHLEESAHFRVLEPLVMTSHQIIFVTGLLLFVGRGELISAALVNACP